jgi:hypothetical protein
VDKKTVQKHGGFDENFKGMYEDQVFLTKIYLNETVYISSNCNNFYRQRKDSLVHMSHAQGAYYEHRGFFLKWMDRYLQLNAADNKNLRNLMRSAQFPYKYPTFQKVINYYHSVKKRISKFLRKKRQRIFLLKSARERQL